LDSYVVSNCNGLCDTVHATAHSGSHGTGLVLCAKWGTRAFFLCLVVSSDGELRQAGHTAMLLARITEGYVFLGNSM